MGSILRDARFSLRSLLKRPGFAAVVIVTLALGIGANTAIFSVVYNVLLRPLPYPESEELVAVWSRFLPESGFDFQYFPVAPPEFFEYRRESDAMEDLVAYYTFGATITGGDSEPERLRAIAAGANLFSLLGVEAALGRTFVAEEDVPQGPSVAALSHSLWRRRYGANPDIVGRTVSINGRSTEVIGVMPEGFAFPNADVDLYVPLGIDPESNTNRRAHFLAVVGRLADGALLDGAKAEMDALMDGWKQEYPDIHTGHFLVMRPLLDQMVGHARTALLVLLAAVGFVLVVVCANVANLLLVRGEGRRREIALRMALGADRWRVLQQLLIESAVVSLVGGGLGLLVASFGVDLLLSFDVGVIPRAEGIGLDASVFLFAAAITGLTTLIFGLVPALQARSTVLGRVLKEGGRSGAMGPTRLGFRRVLVVTQVAVSLILAVGAGLLIRSFVELTDVDSGIRPENLLVGQVSLPSGDYPEADQVIAFYTDLRERLAELPGVVSASGIWTLPLQSTPPNIDFDIEGLPPPPPGSPAHSGYRIVALPDFTRSLGVRVLEGRGFRESDRADALPVAIINRRMARLFWPNRSPIGQRIRQAGSPAPPWLTIVGVVEDVKYDGLETEDNRPVWYVPEAQAPGSINAPARTMSLTLRTEGDPMASAGALRSSVWELDPNLPITGLRSMEDVLADSIARPRFTMTLMLVFACVALVLGAVGIYGVIAYAIARRTQELGIRMALGAEPRRLAMRVVAEGLLLATVGVIIGLGAALLGSRLITALLFGVSPFDPVAFVAAVAVLLWVAVVASWLPARRATRIDPALALREE